MDVISFPSQCSHVPGQCSTRLAVHAAIPTNPIHFALSYQPRLKIETQQIRK